jgi:hypothetical protein
MTNNTDGLQSLCDENIKTRSDFRKWSIHNHPDKVKNTNRHENFSKVSQLVSEYLPLNESKIDCDEFIPKPKVKSPSPKVKSPSPKPKSATPKPPSPKSPKPINIKKADCIRKAENWTKILSHQRFDKPSFDMELFKKDMENSSPKMVELLNTIRQLDKKDFNKEGKKYKHFIFSDVKKGGFGAKIIASALVANGFNHCFTKSLKIVKPKDNDNMETFGVLSSTAIYDTPFTQKHVKSVLKMYNERPTNVYGENMRFIVLDSGFKEGIDLFDVKYVHIFENQRNQADLIQAVGRATRSCGQKGLNFVPNVGWKLHIYQYYLTYEDPTSRVFDDYLRHAGVDLNTLEFSENVEKIAIETAVDYDLNININKYEVKVDDELLKLGYINGGSSNKTSSSSSSLLGCGDNDKCGKKSTKAVPFSITMFKKVYKKKLPDKFDKLSAKDKRIFFCQQLRTDSDFCKNVNHLYKSILEKNKTNIKQKTSSNQLALYEDKSSTNLNNKLALYENKSSTKQNNQLALYENKSSTNLNNQLALYENESREIENYMDMKEDMKNTEDMTFEEFQKYINKTFKEYKYKPIKVENMCVEGNKGNDALIKFTESQDFVTRYFVPNHFAKGLLIWHSVGTGKTCTAISVKSFLYERLDYSVIWVTRSTLKEDIWKNMYETICDHVIREKIRNKEDTTNLKKYLSKKFLPPMSYRQFSNMLEGKNALYEKLVKFNGKEDFLKNTLVIIDEAHKLYSKDLIATERPKMNIIEEKLNNSPSCKVMLMTGTPIADDPMEFFKLLNLIMKKDKFPTSFNKFREEFLMNNQFTSSGKSEFQKRTKGLISYLNRRFDPRQFTQPVFHNKPVTMSINKGDSHEDCMSNAKNTNLECIQRIIDIKETNEDLEKLIKEIDTLDKEIKTLVVESKSNKSLKDLVKLKKENYKYLKLQLKEKKNLAKIGLKNVKAEESKCKKEFTKHKKKCKEEMKKKVSMYQNDVLNKC